MSAKEILSVPKLIGCDTELGNVIMTKRNKSFLNRDDQAQAARAMQCEIEGVSTRSFFGGSSHGYYSGLHDWQDYAYVPIWSRDSTQDSSRKFLPNGGCTYIDMSHYELCTPEVLSATDFVAVWQAMLRISQNAWSEANKKLPSNQELSVTVDNTDRKTSSWGNHTNVLISRDLHDRLCSRHTNLVDLYSLASFQASSIIITGAGKTGSENKEEQANFQISQRADWFECMQSLQTTYARPVVNTRDESLTDAHSELGRLHSIFYDANLCHVATYLKVGVLQIVLALMEINKLPRKLILEDPLTAVKVWSRDLEFRTSQKTFFGDNMTALCHQLNMFSEIKKAIQVSDIDFETIVPGYGNILECWGEVLNALQNKQWDYLTGKLDWITRKQMLEQVMAEHNFGWASPEIQHMDLTYGNLNPEVGLFWKLQAAGIIEELVDNDTIEHFTHIPPENTRAYTRGCLVDLHMLSNSGVTVKSVDWDKIAVDAINHKGNVIDTVSLSLGNPLSHTKAHTERAFFEYDRKPKAKKLLNTLENL